MSSEAALKAWATRRARAAGQPVPSKPAPIGAAECFSGSRPEMNAAQKAWATRRARLAEAGSVSVAAPIKKPATAIERVSAILEPKREMTAGEKAAETKRLEAQARADAELMRKGISNAPAIQSPTVTMWVDDAKVGCGIRNFVVIEIGPRWVRMFHVATLQEVRVTRIEFDRYATPYKAKNLIKRIDDHAAMFDRLSTPEHRLDYSVRAVKEVRAAVEAYLAKGGKVTVCEPRAETVSQAAWARAARAA